MWERFSYYGMRALLVFYMIKGFLGYGDEQAYSVYGAYTALVYMTPFIGGMLADRILGQRRAIVIGGSLMAAGHLLMTIEHQWSFFFALALLIVGNGFFKPNISTTVGVLYPPGAKNRDDGFNIFYMGINLGAAMSPLLCGYVGETYGWHYGFGLATIGMLTGLAVFVMPNAITQAETRNYHGRYTVYAGADCGGCRSDCLGPVRIPPRQHLGPDHQFIHWPRHSHRGSDRMCGPLARWPAEVGWCAPGWR